MPDQVTVTAKISVELKKKLSKLGVNVSEFTRDALQKEVDRLERERRKKLAEEASEILQKIPAEELVKAVRAGRKNH